MQLFNLALFITGIIALLFLTSMALIGFVSALSRSKERVVQKTRIALDESIGFAKTNSLKGMGYDIVCIARHAEKDVSWLNRAFANGALFVVSPDLDIPNLIEKENYPMIWIDYLHVPKEKGGEKYWAAYVDKRIKAKIVFLKTHFGSVK